MFAMSKFFSTGFKKKTIQHWITPIVHSFPTKYHGMIAYTLDQKTFISVLLFENKQQNFTFHDYFNISLKFDC